MLENIEQVRKMARIKAQEAAPFCGIEPRLISHYCVRGRIPDAVKLGKHWYVTPSGMDRLFEGKKTKR